MKPYKILIIEDDPVIQGEMETLLRGDGYTAVSVKDFSKVTDTFKAEEPHLILLDILFTRKQLEKRPITLIRMYSMYFQIVSVKTYSR